MISGRLAWVLGGSDPNSGTASQFEVIRGLGTLLKKGWKPLRTIILASWDAEEYGLIGSTEWAEDFGDWLQTNSEFTKYRAHDQSGDLIILSSCHLFEHGQLCIRKQLPRISLSGELIFSPFPSI